MKNQKRLFTLAIAMLFSVMFSKAQTVSCSFTVVSTTNDYEIRCNNPTVLLTTSVTSGGPFIYTWSTSCGNFTGPSASFTAQCSGQVVGTTTNGCSFTQTFAVTQNLISPTVAVTPTVMSITCSTVAPSTFTGTSNLGPNVTSNWFQIVGTNTIYVGTPQTTINIFQPSAAGVYWFVSVNNLNGCASTRSVQVNSSVGLPTFTVTSPSNFTVGCATTSLTSIQVSSVVTDPANQPVNYAYVPPPGTATPVFTINPNLNNISVPGTYVVYVRDITNNCTVSQSISIIQNIIPPNIDFIQPLSSLSCRNPSMVLNGISNNPNTSITWTVPASPSPSINPTPNATVNINPSVSGSTANITVIGIFTVGAVDINNQCRATKTVQINQDLRLPVFFISAQTNSVITCKNPDVVIIPVVSTVIAFNLIPTYTWIPPVGPPVPGSQYNSIAAGSHSAISMSSVNGCTTTASYIIASDLINPALNPAGNFTLDCNTNPTVSIIPSITGTTTGFTYSWTVPFGALTSNLTSSLLTTNQIGTYSIVVTNTINGCKSNITYEVVPGSITASFTANEYSGFAPFVATFINNSQTSTGASSIISTWGFGNGVVTNTILNSTIQSHTYTAAGTYSVLLTVRKGACIDTALRIIKVELPSKMEVPNVFTPNGDKVNDFFRILATNLSEVDAKIYDRWGNVVYQVISESGNIEWDGKNLQGAECPSGTYFYIIKAKGKDGEEYDQKGNVSLFR